MSDHGVSGLHNLGTRMSGQKLKSLLSNPMLAALAALALASGCRMLSPRPATTASTASPSDIRQASFEGDEIEPKQEIGLEDFYPDQIGKTVKKMVSEPPNKKEAKKNFE